MFAFIRIRTLLEVADGVIVASNPVLARVAEVVEATSVFTALTTCNTFPNPVAVPLFVSVTPDGTVNVSPVVPSVTVPEPVRGDNLSAFISLISDIYPLLLGVSPPYLRGIHQREIASLIDLRWVGTQEHGYVGIGLRLVLFAMLQQQFLFLIRLVVVIHFSIP
jgi:hypothetical protein